MNANLKRINAQKDPSIKRNNEANLAVFILLRIVFILNQSEWAIGRVFRRQSNPDFSDITGNFS